MTPGSGLEKAGKEGKEGKEAPPSPAEAAVTIHVDEVSGRRYRCNTATGHTQWLSDDDELDDTTIEEQGDSANMIRIGSI